MAKNVTKQNQFFNCIFENKKYVKNQIKIFQSAINDMSIFDSNF